MISIYIVDVSKLTQKQYDVLYFHASPDRKLRADHCRSRENAACCLVSEALLRYAVTQSLGLSEFVLQTNPHGKPYLSEWPGFHFNISHSGNWVALACGDTPVGIDVQQPGDPKRQEGVVRRFFTEAEQRFVFAQPDGRQQRFLEIWTAKESYLKCLGTGLQKPLNSFDVCTMAEPRFYTRWLGESCMTLCTTENGYQISEIKGESLCVMSTAD